MSTAIKKLVEAARVVVKAHVAMKSAYRDEASQRVKAAKQQVLFQSLEKLSDASLEFEKVLTAAKFRKPTGPGFDWTGMFRTVNGFVDLLVKAKAAPLKKEDVKDFIEAEIIESR